MILGIDISKEHFDVALLNPDAAGKDDKAHHQRFANEPVGFEALAAWLERQGVTSSLHACMEATGTYFEALALFLHERGHLVSVVNPSATSAFAKSQLSRTKTDKVDAALIARFCRTQRPAGWVPAAVELRELQALVRRLEALEQMLRMEANRLAAGVSSASVRTSLEEHIRYLEEQMKCTRQLIHEHIQRHPSLKQQSDLLTSIPGIAEATAAALLAELSDMQHFGEARQVAAFAGLVPRIRQSGKSVGKYAGLSKIGSGRIRKTLFFPAMVAMRFNPCVRALAERLREKGKAKMLIVGAAMRKLLCIAYGVLKSAQPFDPLWLKAA